MITNHPELTYLDNANTTLKPRSVIDAINSYYRSYDANIGRTSYGIAVAATNRVNESRQLVANFIGVHSDEVVFTYSSTYAINQIALGLIDWFHPGDIILLTLHEHNSNLIPWLEVASRTGATIKYVDDLNPDADFSRVKLFAYSLMSNITGKNYNYVNIARQIHDQGGLIVVDATQALTHSYVDVRRLRYCDFLVFSSHKLYGPSGVGVLYIRRDLQSQLQPLVYGSQTFTEISRDHFKLLSGPQRFEPGTPNIEGIIGLGAAIKFINQTSRDAMLDHDRELLNYYYNRLDHYDLTDYIFGAGPNSDRYAESQGGICALAHPRIHPHDIAMLLDNQNIAVRAGKACADLVADHYHERRGVIRISFAAYTSKSDIEKFVAAYRQAIDKLS